MKVYQVYCYLLNTHYGTYDNMQKAESGLYRTVALILLDYEKYLNDENLKILRSLTHNINKKVFEYDNIKKSMIHDLALRMVTKASQLADNDFERALEILNIELGITIIIIVSEVE